MASAAPDTEHLHAGETVVVRTPAEILATLDADGCLDGLPFMPEMLAWCGRTCTVQRRVEKTCMEVPDPAIHPNRRFAARDVVFLDGPRCDGSGHDGCNRACRIFWKEAWLRRADAPTAHGPADGLDALRARLRTRAEGDRYFCQSTQLLRATEAFPGRQKPWMVRVALQEVRNGDLTASEVIGHFTRWVVKLLRLMVVGDKALAGPHRRTPTQTLALQPGELVRIRSRDEIMQTLDGESRNRGLGICPEMTQLCGGTAEVRQRVDRIIDERTGRMIPLKDTVLLQNLRGDARACEECLCAAEIGDCPRGEQMYWREIWLEPLQRSAPRDDRA